MGEWGLRRGNVEPPTRRGCSHARQVIQTRCVPSSRCVGRNAPERMVLPTHGCIYGAWHGTNGWSCASRSPHPARHGWFRHVFMAGGSRQTHSLGGSPVLNTQRVNLFGNFHRCVSNALAVLIVGEGFHDARARARTCALASRAASVIAVMCVWRCGLVCVKCRSRVTCHVTLLWCSPCNHGMVK